MIRISRVQCRLDYTVNITALLLLYINVIACNSFIMTNGGPGCEVISEYTTDQPRQAAGERFVDFTC